MSLDLGMELVKTPGPKMDNKNSCFSRYQIEIWRQSYVISTTGVQVKQGVQSDK